MADYSDIINAAAAQYNVDPNLLRGVIQTESGGKPGVVSNAGAVGLMQIEPATAQQYGISGDLKDPKTNIFGGAQILSHLLDTSPDVTTALRRYQGGDDQKGWGPVNAAYPGKVLAAGGIAQPHATAASTLPGIPSSAPSNSAASSLSDDAVLSAFTGGTAAPAAAAGPAPGGTNTPPSDDAIFAAFSKSPTVASQTAAQSANPQAPAVGATAAPASQPGMLASFAAGLGHGFGETVLGAQQLLGKGAQALGNAVGSSGISGAGNWLVNDANTGVRNLDAQLAPYQQAHSIMAGAGNIGGASVATLPLSAALPAAAGLGSLVRNGAVVGAGSGALSPVNPDSTDFAGDKLRQIGIGALAGGALAPVAAAVGRVISPNVSPDVQALLDRGVTPTPGQILGGGWARTEDKLTSVPYLGDLIKNAQGRAIQQFNRATYSDALSPIGGSIPDSVPTGSQAVNYVNKQIGDVYKSIEPRANLTLDQNFASDLNAIKTNLSQTAPGVLPQFDNIVQNQIVGKAAGGTPTSGLPIGGALTGSQWGDSRSMISGLSRKLVTGGGADADKWALSGALDDLNEALNSAVGRSSPPDVLSDLNNANAAWARYKQIEKAAGSVGASNNGNIFSPAQYTSAVRAGSTASQKATNGGLNADFGNSAQTVLGSKYPDSGTVGRGLMGLLGGTGLGAGIITAPGSTLATLGGIGAAGLPYTKAGQGLAALLLTARPQFSQPLGNAVTSLGPKIVPGGLATLLSGSR